MDSVLSFPIQAVCARCCSDWREQAGANFLILGLSFPGVFCPVSEVVCGICVGSRMPRPVVVECAGASGGYETPVLCRLGDYRYFWGDILPIRKKQVLTMSRARARSGSLRAISVASPAKPSIWSSRASAYRRAKSGYFASH